uniref:Uncharacterized protein n=1 Tax=Candidatus Kentrum sp. FM TaxID=2126340 RepID=A0A450RYH8_9GAMM|nr:MAG: hypothetical protein BECKFM1743C_GA0114222_100092 [Candidatus Kentron sp. FM]VFJ69803.1 MAG: hypothetical protein BECKFM1743A_GA0114220_105232 [Candidatus Kentron sp. FM]VFK06165.1 MAG: hypothetical protein BECKFM1743B_GA0114221_1001117 [Candidatus Kentron sp. FM]
MGLELAAQALGGFPDLFGEIIEAGFVEMGIGATHVNVHDLFVHALGGDVPRPYFSNFTLRTSHLRPAAPCFESLSEPSARIPTAAQIVFQAQEQRGGFAPDQRNPPFLQFHLHGAHVVVFLIGRDVGSAHVPEDARV